MRRGWLWIAIAAMVAALLFLPLRLALAGSGADGLTARAASGTIWSGRLDQARLGPFDLGTLDVAMSPWPLFVGRARMDFTRVDGGDPLAGALISGFGLRGVDGLTGAVGGGDLGGLPIDRVQFDGARILFHDGACREASGRATVTLGVRVAGLTLRHGLSGDLRCEGRAVEARLAGQSGMERLVLTVDADGAWVARMIVQSGDPALGAGLTAAGFGPTAEGYVRTLRGRF